ncbi:MAG: dethiobiotin synthase [Fibrobacterota bacterium]
MSKGFFIAGTGTDVGKTVISAGLLAYSRNIGKKSIIFKPVQSGAEKINGEWMAPDIRFARKFCDIKEKDTELVSSFYKAAQGPSIAAVHEGNPADIEKIADNYYILSEKYELIFTEGAGGILSPAGPGIMAADIIKKLGLDTLLVSSPALGTINSTLLSAKELESSGIRPRALVFSGNDGNDPYFEDVKREIENLSGIKEIFDIPACSFDNETDRIIFLEKFKNLFETIMGDE